MLKFGLGNLRRLFHVEPIALKPITLLVGRNSSGKSTYLRTFPLLRQSLLTRTSSPILWYGDLVDFGSFDTSLSKGDRAQSMSFSFVIDELVAGGRTAFVNDDVYEYAPRRSEQARFQDISYSVFLERDVDRVRISRISARVGSIDTEFSIDIDQAHFITKLVVNGRDVIPSLAPSRLISIGNSLLPEFRFLRSRDQVEPDETPYLPHLGSATASAVVKLLRSLIDQRIGDQTIRVLASRLLSLSPPSKDRVVEVAKSQGIAVGKTIANAAEYDLTGQFKTISDILYATWITSFMRSSGNYLRSILTNTLYIGPMRARSERYYRYQDLAVSEIDPDGKNFPMFLNSLSDRRIEEFSSWIKSLFGYGVVVSRSSGHISINLTEEAGPTNIVDVGYGVSQILPVLGQIWWARSKQPTRGAEPSALSLLAIEQPELHLHPAHQALLADALIGEIRSVREPRGGAMHYLVETHSETLVNRFGELIADNRINAEEVQVVIFEPDGGGGTKVRTVAFSSAGTLVDWPYGFFQAAVSE